MLTACALHWILTVSICSSPHRENLLWPLYLGVLYLSVILNVYATYFICSLTLKQNVYKVGVGFIVGLFCIRKCGVENE